MKKGWTYKKLGELAVSMADGPFGSNLKAEHYTQNKEVRIIQLSNIGEEGWRDENRKYTTYNHLETIKRSEVCPGDIVIAKMMPAGRAIICPDDESKYVLSSDAVRVTLKDNIDSKYVYYAINSSFFRKQVYENVSGSGRVRTSLTKLRDCVLGLPTVAEQKRIVSRLDAAFSHIDELKANAEKQLSEARVLFQRSLAKAMEPKEGWEKKILNDIVDDKCPISYGIVQQGDHIEGGIPVVRPVDLNKKYVSLYNLKCTTSQISSSYKRTILRGDEILLSVRGTTGIVSIAKPELKGCNVNRGIVPLFFKDNICKDFIYYEMISPFMQSVFAEKTTGSTLKQINIKDLRLIFFTYPSLSEQQRIVKRLDSLSAHIRELEENQKKIISECDALKQALLRKVFK